MPGLKEVRLNFDLRNSFISGQYRMAKNLRNSATTIENHKETCKFKCINNVKNYINDNQRNKYKSWTLNTRKKFILTYFSHRKTCYFNSCQNFVKIRVCYFIQGCNPFSNVCYPHLIYKSISQQRKRHVANKFFFEVQWYGEEILFVSCNSVWPFNDMHPEHIL